MKKDFKQELTELINKHGLEKEMRDTPDFILAQVCIDAMAVFSEAIARRDEWHEFRKADEKSSQDAKHNYPDDCNICKDRFKCADLYENATNCKSDSAFQDDNGQRGKNSNRRIAKTDKRRCVGKASK